MSDVSRLFMDPQDRSSIPQRPWLRLQDPVVYVLAIDTIDTVFHRRLLHRIIPLIIEIHDGSHATFTVDSESPLTLTYRFRSCSGTERIFWGERIQQTFLICIKIGRIFINKFCNFYMRKKSGSSLYGELGQLMKLGNDENLNERD